MITGGCKSNLLFLKTDLKKQPQTNKSVTMRKIFTLIICFVLLFTSNAQPPNYAFQAESGTYTSLVGGIPVVLTYGTSAVPYDDGITTPANAVPIGFTFNYNGSNYTLIKPCANGWASFSTTALTNNTDTWTNNLVSGPAANQRPFIAPLWDDHDMVANGRVLYQLSGTAPNRVLTIEWNNAEWDFNSTVGVMSFQVKLYETTNVIEFIYKQEAGSITPNGGGASIGLTATATGNNTFLSVSDAGTNPSISSTVESSTILTKPETGQIYRWIPFCAASATNTTGVKISNFTYNTINNTSNSTAGYENFTSQLTTTYLAPTSSLPFFATISSFVPTDEVKIFIDFNHNGDFNDPGETVYTSTGLLVSGAITGNINIPAISSSVLTGRTRLRIRVHDTGNGPNATSCGSSTTGQVEDYSIDIQICTAVNITAQPANLGICNGSSGSISIGTTGTGITYQWQVSTNGGGLFSDIANSLTYSGVTSNTLNISGVSLAMNNYQYRVVMNGICTPANTTSDAAILSVYTPAAITTKPIDGKACVGTSITFTSAASGSSPTYQWQVSADGGFNYTNINGATSTTLTLNSLVQIQDGNRYRSVATVASCGSVISTPGILTVFALPVVTASVSPVDQVKPGTTTIVTAGSVPAPVSYVWRFDNTVIPGAVTRSVVADVTGIGKYNVTVTDINGCTNRSADAEVKALFSDRLFIYPNPNDGRFTVRLYSYWYYGPKIVTITNSAGALVQTKRFFANGNYSPMDFDLRGVATGIYIVHVFDEYARTEVVGKVFIQR
jgi:hypothetical protein